MHRAFHLCLFMDSMRWAACRIDAAEEILDRVSAHDDGEPISYEEYEQLIHALEEIYREIGDMTHRTVTDHIKQLGFDKEVFDRQVGPWDVGSKNRVRGSFLAGLFLSF